MYFSSSIGDTFFSCFCVASLLLCYMWHCTNALLLCVMRKGQKMSLSCLRLKPCRKISRTHKVSMTEIEHCSRRHLHNNFCCRCCKNRTQHRFVCRHCCIRKKSDNRRMSRKGLCHIQQQKQHNV